MKYHSCIANIRSGDILYYGSEYKHRILIVCESRFIDRYPKRLIVTAQYCNNIYGKGEGPIGTYDVIEDGNVVVKKIVKAARK